MTDVKRLLDEATPLPWKPDAMYVVGQVPEGRPGGEVIAQCGPSVAMLRNVTPDRANAALIVYAVNNLPAYEAAAEALEQLLMDIAGSSCYEPGAVLTMQAREALSRLREGVPA